MKNTNSTVHVYLKLIEHYEYGAYIKILSINFNMLYYEVSVVK